VRVEVTAQEQELKKKHAGSPDGRAAAEPGKNVFAQQELDLKKKKRPTKNCQAIDGAALHCR
jgi:hypothetical protein